MPWRLLLGLHRAAVEWDVARQDSSKGKSGSPSPSHCRSPQDPQFFVASGKQGRRGGTTQKGLTLPLANANETPAGTGGWWVPLVSCDCSTLHTLHVITSLTLLQHYFSLTTNQHKVKFQRNEQNQNFHSEDRRSRLKSLTQFSETSSFQFRQIPLLQIVCYVGFQIS